MSKRKISTSSSGKDDDNNSDDEPLFLSRKQDKKKETSCKRPRSRKQDKGKTSCKRPRRRPKKNKFVDDEVSVSDSDFEKDDEDGWEGCGDSDLDGFIDDREIDDDDGDDESMHLSMRAISPDFPENGFRKSINRAVKRITEEMVNKKVKILIRCL